MIRRSLTFWACHITASLALVVVGMLISYAVEWRKFDVDRAAAAVESFDVIRSTDTPCEGNLVAFDTIHQEMGRIVEAIGQLNPPDAEGPKDQRPENQAGGPLAPNADGLSRQRRIAALRAQAEHNLQTIVQLEHRLTGQTDPADRSRSSGGATVAEESSAFEAAARHDRAWSAMRQELFESQTIRQTLQTELSNAQHHIEALQEHQATLESDLLGAQQACTAVVASQPPTTETPRPTEQAELAMELEHARSRIADLAQQHERLNRAYQHCRYRVVRASQPAGEQELRDARGEIGALEATRTELQTQLSDATEIADRCVGRLANMDDRLVALMDQVEQLETALNQ